MEGQYSDEEFKEMLRTAGSFRSGINYIEGLAWILYGKYTTNYYRQHSDKSWTYYNCKTK